MNRSACNPVASIVQVQPPIRGGLHNAQRRSRNVQAFVQTAVARVARTREGGFTLEGHEAERRARTRAWAVDSAARVVALVRDLRAGTLAPWLTLEDLRARARLVDVFALLADGHRDAAERLRRSIPRPRASLPPGHAGRPDPHVDPSILSRCAHEAAQARREAITNRNDNPKDRKP